MVERDMRSDGMNWARDFECLKLSSLARSSQIIALEMLLTDSLSGLFNMILVRGRLDQRLRRDPEPRPPESQPGVWVFLYLLTRPSILPFKAPLRRVVTRAAQKG